MSLKLIIKLSLISFLISSVSLAPSKYKNEPPNKNCSDRADNNENDDGYYDQRQNGTENYRISLKDVVLLWAPADSLLTAAAALFGSQLLGDDLLGTGEFPNFELSQEFEKNETETDSVIGSEITDGDKVTVHSAKKPIGSKRSKFRFPALAAPILKKP